VIDVPDRTDVDVRLAPVKFLFRHKYASHFQKTSPSLLGRRVVKTEDRSRSA
jgi:hypothetical protein